MLPLEGSESKQKTYISMSLELRTDHTELHSFMRGLRLSASLWPHVRTQRQCEAAPSPWYCLQHMLLCVCVCALVWEMVRVPRLVCLSPLPWVWKSISFFFPSTSHQGGTETICGYHHARPSLAFLLATFRCDANWVQVSQMKIHCKK